MSIEQSVKVRYQLYHGHSCLELERNQFLTTSTMIRICQAIGHLYVSAKEAAVVLPVGSRLVLVVTGQCLWQHVEILGSGYAS